MLEKVARFCSELVGDFTGTIVATANPKFANIICKWSSDCGMLLQTGSGILILLKNSVQIEKEMKQCSRHAP